MTHRDRAGDPPGRRGAAGDVGHRQGFPTPPAVRPRDRHGGFPNLVDRRFWGGVPRGSRCPASPRHALLAENLGKPSLWVFINEIWYYPRNGGKS